MPPPPFLPRYPANRLFLHLNRKGCTQREAARERTAWKFRLCLRVKGPEPRQDGHLARALQYSQYKETSAKLSRHTNNHWQWIPRLSSYLFYTYRLSLALDVADRLCSVVTGLQWGTAQNHLHAEDMWNENW